MFNSPLLPFFGGKTISAWNSLGPWPTRQYNHTSFDHTHKKKDSDSDDASLSIKTLLSKTRLLTVSCTHTHTDTHTHTHTHTRAFEIRVVPNEKTDFYVQKLNSIQGLGCVIVHNYSSLKNSTLHSIILCLWDESFARLPWSKKMNKDIFEKKIQVFETTVAKMR